AFSQPVAIELDQPVTTNCTMAVALNEWVQQANSLAKTHLGSDIKTIGTGSHYQCRNVNNGAGRRVSEHAFAKALDVMSFTL
ncbi:extensin family protein, partial [Escherichia coli]|nr:extensin family protein [Escherichia coli]